MSQDRFMALNWCLYLTHGSTYVQDCNAPRYDKMGQIQWLVNEVHRNFHKYYDIGKFFMIIGYKEKYYLACQYVPKNPRKW